MKVCRDCGEEKSLDHFYKRTDSSGYSSYCRDCHKVRCIRRAKERYQQDPARYLAEHRIWIKEHPVEAQAMRRRAKLKNLYGITEAEWEQLLVLQDGCCAICRKVPAGSFHVDHDHEAGQVRGLLCNPCNRGLGYFHDDPAALRAAATYLETTLCASS